MFRGFKLPIKMKVILQVAKLTKLWMGLRALYFFPLSCIGKALDTVSQDILINELRKHGLDEGTVRRPENWLDDRAQRVVLNGAESS